MLESEEIMTVGEAIRNGNFNYGSITTLISRERKKGRDFKRFMNTQLQNLLAGQKIKVAKALINGAVSESHADRKLFFQLTGDLKEQAVSVTNTLTIGIAVNVPYPCPLEEKGVIDVEPVVPEGK